MARRARPRGVSGSCGPGPRTRRSRDFPPTAPSPSPPRMPRPDRDRQATTSCECRTALLTSHAIPGFLGHADAESFPETVLSRRGDDHSAAVLHRFGPAQIETTLGEGGSYRARDVWPSFGPVDAQSAEVTAF